MFGRNLLLNVSILYEQSDSHLALGHLHCDDPERPDFEKAVEELEKRLQETIVRSKKQRFAIAFCGMVKAGKSLVLNALMGG
jgi:ribosome biogenesis GTPase A